MSEDLISKRFFVAKLRELNYTHVEQKKRVDMWRKRGGIHYVAIPRCDLLEADYVRMTLRHAGLTHEQIEGFLRAARA